MLVQLPESFECDPIQSGNMIGCENTIFVHSLKVGKDFEVRLRAEENGKKLERERERRKGDGGREKARVRGTDHE